MNDLLLVVVFLQAVVVSSQFEQSHLYNFYKATSGWLATCSDGWSANATPLCAGNSSNWSRVTCLNGYVSEINLFHGGICAHLRH